MKVLFLLLLFCPCLFYSQDSTTIVFEPHVKNEWDNNFLFIKTNPIQDAISDANLSFEKSLRNDFSIDVKLQYQYWRYYGRFYSLFTGTGNAGDGFGGHIMLRKYGFLKSKSIFFSAGPFFKIRNLHEAWYNFDGGVCYIFDGSIYKYGLKTLVGVQARPFKGAGVFEFFWGMGIGKRVEQGRMSDDCGGLFPDDTPYYWDGVSVPLYMGFNLGFDLSGGSTNAHPPTND